VDFRNTIIIMTSNIGAKLINRGGPMGFAIPRDEVQTQEDEYKEIKERVMEALKKTFRPEFINRLDGVMVFRPLTREQITEIVDLEMKRVCAQLTEHDIKLEITEVAKRKIAEEGYDPDFGARPLRRVIQREIEDPLSEGLLAGRYKAGDEIVIDLDSDGKLALNVVESANIEPDEGTPQVLEVVLG
jgi:ATP-dependent Clp protease ATP-binding subunit ClpC